MLSVQTQIRLVLMFYLKVQSVRQIYVLDLWPVVRKASSVRRRYVEEAKRRALVAKLKLFEEQQALAERKFQLQQQEKRLKIKSDLIQIAAKEQVYAEADALERGSTFELDLKSKELSPQNCKIKEREETGAAKVEREGLNPVVSSSLPPCEQGMYQS